MMKSKFPYRMYNGIPLSTQRRNGKLRDSGYYMNSAFTQIADLSWYAGYLREHRLLDFGCGHGRLAGGLLLRVPDISYYLGIDTQKGAVEWCKHHLKQDRSNFDFIHVPAHNARYNSAEKLKPAWPVDLGSFDIVFMNSVFSHMLVEDVQFYLDQSFRALDRYGLLYTTGFIEEGVPEVNINPPDYLGRKHNGPLHVVRYDKKFFLTLIEQAGFRVIEFQHQGIDWNRQSVVIARKN